MKRVVAIALAAWLCHGAAAEAQPKWKNYRAVAVAFPKRSNDPAMTVFRSALFDIAQKKDAEALQKRVARDFFWERDFGGGFDKQKSGFINFAAALSLAAEDGTGWRLLAAFADQLTGPHAQKKGVFCGPPAPQYDEKEFETLVSRTNSDAYDWSYPAHAHVIAREKGEPGSPEVAKLSMHFVYTDLSARGENFDPAKDWTPVILRDGKRAFVPPGELLTLLDPRLCYVKRGGDWLVAGYIGGGD
jgi:hypothetical protein